MSFDTEFDDLPLKYAMFWDDRKQSPGRELPAS